VAISAGVRVIIYRKTSANIGTNYHKSGNINSSIFRCNTPRDEEAAGALARSTLYSIPVLLLAVERENIYSCTLQQEKHFLQQQQQQQAVPFKAREPPQQHLQLP